jgi:hypothetical protein
MCVHAAGARIQQTNRTDGDADWDLALLPEFEGKLPPIHDNAQEKEIEMHPEVAHLISHFFSEQRTIHALEMLGIESTRFRHGTFRIVYFLNLFDMLFPTGIMQILQLVARRHALPLAGLR